MKKYFSYIFVIQLFILISHSAVSQFQPTDVVKTQEKTIVNGKIFYIHTVLKGQTLYSISKAYEVTQEAIKVANPQVDVVNLREGLALKIPDSNTRQAAVYPENREDFDAHSVKRGQTVFSLSKKYNVDEEVIYHYNPWAREGIKPNQTLWIPRNKEMRDISESARTQDLFYYYTTKEKDTLYSIARLYGIEVADIIDANPILRDGLKPEQVLKIPRIAKADPSLMVPVETAVDPDLPCIPPVQPVSFNVALMLPFFSTFQPAEIDLPADTLAEEGTYVPLQKQQGLRGRNFAEFYEGFMLALDSMKRTGFSVNLHVYDTERDTVRTKKITQELSLIKPDLIIGPVYSEDVQIAGRLADYQEVQLVSPLSTRSSLVNRNAHIIQIIPSRQAESYALANYLRQYSKGRILLIRGTDSISLSNSWIFKKYLKENPPLDIEGNPLYFKDYFLNDSLLRVLSKVLSREEENILVVFSDHEPDVSRLVDNLFTKSSLYPVQLFGMPSWQNWKSIDLNYYHSLQLHLITPFYTDYTNLQVSKFLTRSRIELGYQPDEIGPLGYNFTMLGYDIGLYFLSALQQYGRNFMPCADQVRVGQLMTKFRFQKTGDGGYMNINFNIIRYKKDFTIEKTALIEGIPLIPPVKDLLPANPDSAVPPTFVPAPW